MSRANYKCPDCGGRLTNSGGKSFECQQCGGSVHEAVAEHQEALQTLAESDLPCQWIAERLLAADGGER